MKKIFFGILTALGLAIGGFAVYSHFFTNKSNEKEQKNEETLSEDSSYDDLDYIKPIDAEAYLSEIGEIINQYDAASSEDVITEKDLINMLMERGFDEYPVETNYSMDGEYYELKKISQDSSEKHPIYETYFVSSAESIWYIEIVNGSIYVSSLSYNLQEDLKVPVIISETEYITSYDSATNQYFEVIPDSSEMIVKVVPTIDAELLESLTIEEIGEL